MTQAEIAKAKFLWQLQFSEPKSRSLPNLKEVRAARQLTIQSLAQRLEISKATYANFEKGETLGSISLNNLRKAAGALDCELIYFIRPVGGKSFSDLLWDQMLEELMGHPWLRKCDQKRRAWALLGLARRKILEPKFRKKMGWASLFHRE